RLRPGRRPSDRRVVSRRAVPRTGVSPVRQALALARIGPRPRSTAPVPESITITDNRSGESVEVPIAEGGVDASEWRKLLPNVWFYDEAFTTTAATRSAITEIDGDAGILRYRGYPIEQLAESSTYLEVAYLLIHGE